MTSSILQVVTGLIVRDGLMLLTQRCHEDRAFPLLWECPGGKVERGDLDEPEGSPVRALLRELWEEIEWPLHRQPRSSEPFFTTLLKGIDHGREVDAQIHFFVLDAPRYFAPELREVAGCGWFSIDQMARLELMPGNVRLLEYLRERGLP